MPDLEKACPRCARAGQAPPPAPAQARPPRNAARSTTGYWIAGVLAALFAITIGLAMLREPLRIWQAAVLTTSGSAKHEVGDFDGARRSYAAALRKCPELCVAEGNLGLACLGAKGATGLDEAAISRLIDAGTSGNTMTLDEADRHFKAAIQSCKTRPDLLKRVRFEYLDSYEQITPGNFCAQNYLNLCVTAIVRAAAAENAGQLTDRDAWGVVARKHIQNATSEDPSNVKIPSLSRLLASVGY